MNDTQRGTVMTNRLSGELVWDEEVQGCSIRIGEMLLRLDDLQKQFNAAEGCKIEIDIHRE